MRRNNAALINWILVWFLKGIEVSLICRTAQWWKYQIRWMWCHLQMLFCIFLSRFASFSCVCSLLSFEYLTLYPCLLSVFVYSYLFGLWKPSTFASFSDCSLEVSNTLDFRRRFLAYACLLLSILSCFYWVVSFEHFTLCLSLVSASLCCFLLISFWEFSFPQPGSSRVSLLLFLVFEICSSFLFNYLTEKFHGYDQNTRRGHLLSSFRELMLDGIQVLSLVSFCRRLQLIMLNSRRAHWLVSFRLPPQWVMHDGKWGRWLGLFC